MLTPAEDYSPATSYEEGLRRAARAWGVQEEYWDVFGNKHIADAEIERSILRSMGFQPDSLASLNDAIRRRADLEWAVLAPPTLVVSLSRGEAPINTPSEWERGNLEAEFHWEDGKSETTRVQLESLRTEGELALDGERVTRRWLPLPAVTPLGYHRLILRSGGLQSESKLIVCPDRAFQPKFLANGGKAAGIAVSLYGLRSGRNWGCGDFTDLQHFCDWALDTAGVSFVALNPLHSIPNRQPYNTSPYLPNCSFYRNALYLDVEEIPAVQSSAAAKQLLAGSDIRNQLQVLRESEYVEYEKVWALKLRFLKLGFEEVASRSLPKEFQHYLAAEGDLLDSYALYCALEERIHEENPNIWIWPDWPDCYKTQNSPEIKQFRDKHEKLLLFYKWVQWHVDRQLAAAQKHAIGRGLQIGLYHDLALATDRCGSDLWAHGPFYVTGCRVGAPPDEFSPKGQDWAFPPPNSLQHKLDGYRLFAESIRKNCRHGGALRIDHVMRFFRLFWIPENKDATQGTYVLDYAQDLVRILALESVRNSVIVIGEDLGTVAPHIREELHRFGILSYRLLYFEKDDNGFRTPQEYPREALVSVSTHDLPTLAGFWQNRDIEIRRQTGILPDEQSFQSQLRDRAMEKQKLLDLFHRLQLLPEWFPRRADEVREFTGELHYAAVGFLSSTPSVLMVLNQEDLFKDTDQQNMPGTTDQYPNWRHKMRYAIEELRTDPQAQACTNMFHDWLERTGRLNRAS